MTNIENKVDTKTINQYAYVTEVGTSTVIFTFSSQREDCNILKDKEKTDCEAEQKTFNPDSIAVELFKSLKKL